MICNSSRWADFDWRGWIPRETAVLSFIRSGDKLLLIEKKRGLGAGKVNAPGGRLEPGETAIEAAVRETREEVGVEPVSPSHHASIDFQFTDGYAMRCHVFLANSLTGNLRETDEAIPFWVEVSRIPFERMWQDDRYWLPAVLDGHFLTARFVFDTDKMLQMRVETVPYERLVSLVTI